MAKLRETEQFIDNCEVDENAPYNAYHEVISALEDCIDFDYFEHLLDQLPRRTEEEEDLGYEIRQRLEALSRRRDDKIREVGYEPD